MTNPPPSTHSTQPVATAETEQVNRFMKDLWFLILFFLLLLMIASFGLIAEA